MVKELAEEIPKGYGIVVLDFENIMKGVRDHVIISKEEWDLSAGFKKLKDWWNSIANFEQVFAFAPENALWGYTNELHEQGFYIMLRPKITEVSFEGVKYRDTTDQGIIDFIKYSIEFPNLKFLCLGSGDAHFAPVLREARAKGIKIAVVEGGGDSLSLPIYHCIDAHPVTCHAMLHRFSPRKP